MQVLAQDRPCVRFYSRSEVVSDVMNGDADPC